MNDYFPVEEGASEEVLSDGTEVPLPESLDLSKSMETNVLGSSVATDPVDSAQIDEGDGISRESSDASSLEVSASTTLDSNTNAEDSSDFESENYANWATNVYIRDDQIKSSGFANAILSNEPHNGFVFKTVYVDDLYDLNVTKTLVKSAEILLAKIYVLQVGPASSITEVYEVLKVRASEGLDTEINETNEFGQGSFFMNDAKRSGVAFLTVKISNMIYAFSYPKEYHAQIRNLITLLDYEF